MSGKKDRVSGQVENIVRREIEQAEDFLVELGKERNHYDYNENGLDVNRVDKEIDEVEEKIRQLRERLTISSPASGEGGKNEQID